MLLQAAADQWSVPVGEVTVADGVITHGASGRRTSYGKVASAAAKLTPPDPKSIALKNPRDWKIAGKPMKRLDTADKLDGSKVYAIDVRLPGMLFAAVKACPVFGGKLVSYDEAKVSGRPGFRRVVKVNDAVVAVVADTWWRAKSTLDALPIVWDEGAGATQTSAKIAEHLASGLTASGAYAFRSEGDAPAAIERAAKKVEAVYSTPFLAHATMEPMNCTVRISADRAECWVPTQNAEASMAALSEVVGRAAGPVRGVPARSRRRLRPARRHPGLRPPGRRHRQAVPRRAGEDDLVARGGHGPRLLPAHLPVQAGGRPRRHGRARRPPRARSPASRSTRSRTPR